MEKITDDCIIELPIEIYLYISKFVEDRKTLLNLSMTNKNICSIIGVNEELERRTLSFFTSEYFGKKIADWANPTEKNMRKKILKILYNGIFPLVNKYGALISGHCVLKAFLNFEMKYLDEDSYYNEFNPKIEIYVHKDFFKSLTEKLISILNEEFYKSVKKNKKNGAKTCDCISRIWNITTRRNLFFETDKMYMQFYYAIYSKYCYCDISNMMPSIEDFIFPLFSVSVMSSHCAKIETKTEKETYSEHIMNFCDRELLLSCHKVYFNGINMIIGKGVNKSYLMNKICNLSTSYSVYTIDQVIEKVVNRINNNRDRINIIGDTEFFRRFETLIKNKTLSWIENILEYTNAGFVFDFIGPIFDNWKHRNNVVNYYTNIKGNNRILNLSIRKELNWDPTSQITLTIGNLAYNDILISIGNYHKALEKINK